MVLYERNVALLAGLRDDALVPRASFFALEHVRRARAAGVGRQVIAHEDLLVFRPARNPLRSANVTVLHREPRRPRRGGRSAGAPVGGQDEAA